MVWKLLGHLQEVGLLPWRGKPTSCKRSWRSKFYLVAKSSLRYVVVKCTRMGVVQHPTNIILLSVFRVSTKMKRDTKGQTLENFLALHEKKVAPCIWIMTSDPNGERKGGEATRRAANIDKNIPWNVQDEWLVGWFDEDRGRYEEIITTTFQPPLPPEMGRFSKACNNLTSTHIHSWWWQYFISYHRVVTKRRPHSSPQKKKAKL